MREFTRGEPACGMGNEGVGARRRGEFAILLEDGPYEGQHIFERVVLGRMQGCGVCRWRNVG